MITELEKQRSLEDEIQYLSDLKFQLSEYASSAEVKEISERLATLTSIKKDISKENQSNPNET